MASAGFPLGVDADSQGMIAFVNQQREFTIQLQAEIIALKQQMAQQQQQQQQHPPQEPKRDQQLKVTKSFQSVPKWNGDEKSFTDFDFKLHQFVEPHRGFEKWLDWVKDLDEEPDEAVLQKLAEDEHALDANVDCWWMNRQIFSILSLTTEDTALQTCKSVKEKEQVRGAVSWFRLTREVAGKTGVRLERLADKVHKPKKMVGYSDGIRLLTAWDQDCRELAKIEGQEISELTKRTTLKEHDPSRPGARYGEGWLAEEVVSRLGLRPRAGSSS